MALHHKGRVCVTGAGGFVASWVINLLLSKGYLVHGTVRQPEDEKNAHLFKLERAEEKLRLFRTDLLDYDSMLSAIEGCDGVFHIASPVEVVETAVKGTLNVAKACVEAKVKRLVFVSSAAAVGMNPKWSAGQALDETCWSDKDYCRTIKHWYSLSKTEAESEAMEFGEKSGLDVVAVCPSLVLGPILQTNVNASSLILLKLFKGGNDERETTLENKERRIVDVRDVAEAVVMAYEKTEAQGRYICTSHPIKTSHLVDKLRIIYPHPNYPNNFFDVEKDIRLSSEKLQRLGWRFRALDETLMDSLKSYQDAELLDNVIHAL
ncbi:hypothetical protein FEM48_Zijuj06G0003100 [Ziziphus jujuba var. spinosa]|uniref:NAD-dependent epimerase/dehydratase domain-containing protein n=1 Tax=Ziziphus jujuba var. spinosa TaxID=714518 RepID=A0A978V630_ZIZJJ|nr:hypothetical protein FEM48_Zijuj06G0003100 [Ziziphus jujuba var. spinosa]